MRKLLSLLATLLISVAYAETIVVTATPIEVNVVVLDHSIPQCLKDQPCKIWADGKRHDVLLNSNKHGVATVQINLNCDYVKVETNNLSTYVKVQ